MRNGAGVCRKVVMMGRGSSKLSAVGGTATVTQRRGASFSTSDAVDAINAARKDGSRSEIREAIEGIREGQSITMYNAAMHGTSELKNVAENPVIWTKGDQYWRSSDGRAKSDQEMTREIYNASYNRKAGGRRDFYRIPRRSDWQARQGL